MAVSSNALIAFPNYMGGIADGLSVTPIMYGGSWQLLAPLSILTSRFLAYRARSNGVSPASTMLVIDLGMLRSVYTVVVPKHNCTRDAVYSAKVYTDAALTNLVGSSSGATSPVVYPSGTIPYEHPSWFDGRVTAEDYALQPPPLLAVLGANAIGRYVVIAISDPGNPAGYVEISRPIVAPGYQPSFNVDYGAGLQISDPTVITATLGGARMFDARQKQRVFRGSISHLPTNEAFSNFFDMQLRSGVSKTGFFSFNPTDLANLARWSFPATFSQLDALTAASFGYTGVSISIQECVA